MRCSIGLRRCPSTSLGALSKRQILPPGPCRRSLDSEASRWYREELGANPSGGSIFPSSASRDFVRDWNSTHLHEPVVGTSTHATRSAFVDRPRRESIFPVWWNSRHTALRRQRPHGHAGLPAIARPGRASAGAIDSFRLAKLGASPRTSGAPLRSFHTLRLSPGPIYRDVAEPVYATGREPAGGNLIRVQERSSATGPPKAEPRGPSAKSASQSLRRDHFSPGWS